MEKDIKSLFADKVRDFRLPRYSSLPNVGLYLEQVTKYINGLLSPLDFGEITSSMISNYVKKGVIDSPVRKLYYPEQIAYLIFISIGKNVMAINEISDIYKIQKVEYACDVAYDYFCLEFENMLQYIAGLKDTLDNVGVTNTELKNMLRSVIASVANLEFSQFSLAEFRKKTDWI